MGGETSRRSAKGCGTLWDFEMGGDISVRSGTDRGTLGEFRDWSGDSRGVLRRVGGPTERSGMVRWTIGDIPDGWRDYRSGPE